MNTIAARAALKEAEDMAASSAPDGSALEKLKYAYLRMEGDAELEAFLDELLARSRDPKLLSRGEAAAFSLSSAPVHRFMLARAVQRGRIRIDVGSLLEQNEVVFVRRGGHVEDLGHQDLIVRHGPTGVIDRLVTADALEALKPKQFVLSKYHYEPLFPRDYFEPSVSSREHEERMCRKLRTATPALAKQYPGATSFLVRRDGDNFVYEIGFDGQQGGAALDELPSHIFGAAVVGVVQNRFDGLGGPLMPAAGQGGAEGHVLRAGDLLCDTPDGVGNDAFGTVGCFVTRSEGAFVLTARHVFREDAVDVWAMPAGDKLGGDWTLVGRLEVADGVNDVALVSLEPDLGFSVDGRDDLAERPSYIGEIVTRRGSGRDVVTGVVTGRATAVRIHVRGVEKVLPEAFLVLGSNATPFATKGDSGGLVRSADNLVMGIVVASNGREVLVTPVADTVRRAGGAIAKEGRSGRPLLDSRSGWVDAIANKVAADQPAIAPPSDPRPLVPVLQLAKSDIPLVLKYARQHLFYVPHLVGVDPHRLTMMMNSIHPIQRFDIQGTDYHIDPLGKIFKEGAMLSEGMPVPLYVAVLAVHALSIEAFTNKSTPPLLEPRSVAILPAVYRVEGLGTAFTSGSDWPGDARGLVREMRAGHLVTWVTAASVLRLLKERPPNVGEIIRIADLPRPSVAVAAKSETRFLQDLLDLRRRS